MTIAKNENFKAKLRKILEEYFSYDELEVLSYDLGFSADVFGKTSKLTLCLRIVDYCSHHSKLKELVEKIKQERPEISERLDGVKDEKASGSLYINTSTPSKTNLTTGSVDFVRDLRKFDADGSIYRKALKIITRAKNSVQVVWAPSQFPKPANHNRGPKWRSARVEYYENLLTKCRTKRSFRYSRILQLPPSRYIQTDVNDGVIEPATILERVALLNIAATF